MTLTITDNAKKRILETGKEGEFVRISLLAGGCHGFSYKFAFDTEVNQDDYVLKDQDGSVLAVIKKSFAEKLVNTILDFKKTISASYFVLESNNFETTCGCGTSFSVKS
jgi:iron-sulfur cluster insertion protein